jgi:putative flippase GtrA
MTTDVLSPGSQASPLPTSRRPWRQLIRFAVVGVFCTGAYALLYWLLRPALGAFAANALALLLTAVANTAANRRLTFGVRGVSGVVGDHAVGLAAFGAGLALTTGSLAGLHLITDPSRLTELIVLMTANAMATLLRFAALRLRIGRTAVRQASR